MEALIRAATDFLAAMFNVLGFVGPKRRRVGIREDLDLIAVIRRSEAFGPDSRAHRMLVDHVTSEVAKLSGIEIRARKKIPWASVLVALAIGLPLAYWTYRIDENGFRWWSVFPGSVAALMLIGALGMLFNGDEVGDQEAAADVSVIPEGSDIAA